MTEENNVLQAEKDFKKILDKFDEIKKEHYSENLRVFRVYLKEIVDTTSTSIMKVTPFEFFQPYVYEDELPANCLGTRIRKSFLARKFVVLIYARWDHIKNKPMDLLGYVDGSRVICQTPQYMKHEVMENPCNINPETMTFFNEDIIIKQLLDEETALKESPVKIPTSEY